MDRNSPFWYVVYTKPRWEKKVAELLTNKEIQNYCPVHRVNRKWHDRNKVIHEPLFPSYVFVRATVMQLSVIREINGIINFVYWLGKPAVIRNEEIETIRQFLLDYDSVRLEKTIVNLEDTVRILQGPLINKEGKVVEVLHRTVKVLLPSLGYALVAEIEKSHIEPIMRASEKSTYIKALSGN